MQSHGRFVSLAGLFDLLLCWLVDGLRVAVVVVAVVARRGARAWRSFRRNSDAVGVRFPFLWFFLLRSPGWSCALPW